MNPSLTEAIKEAYAVAPTDLVIINTLEIRQDGVQDRIYLAQSFVDVTAKDEDGNWLVFRKSGFQFNLPPSNQEGYQSLDIAIDNIGREVTDFIQAAKSQRVVVEVLYRPYLNTDLTVPQMNPPLVLYLKDVKLDSIQVTGRATFMDIVNKKFPSELYDRERFPTL